LVKTGSLTQTSSDALVAIWKIFKFSSRTLRGIEGFRSGSELVQQGLMGDPKQAS
jgi:hypothetical protein